MTFLLTVSPKEAVELLNGNATSLVRSWKVPLGTAYIGVRKERPYLAKTLPGYSPEYVFIPDKAYGQVSAINGLVVAKCEITECEKQAMIKPELFTALRHSLYILRFSSLSVLDKPMEVSQFKGNGITGRYDTGVKIYGWKPLTRLPSRWQEVEVGE